MAPTGNPLQLLKMYPVFGVAVSVTVEPGTILELEATKPVAVPAGDPSSVTVPALSTLIPAGAVRLTVS